jgi:hypothetical protein
MMSPSLISHSYSRSGSQEPGMRQLQVIVKLLRRSVIGIFS